MYMLFNKKKPRLILKGMEYKFEYNGFSADVDTEYKRVYLRDDTPFSNSHMSIDLKDLDHLIEFLTIIRDRQD